MFGWFTEARHGPAVRKQLLRARSIDIARCVDGERQRVTGVAEGETPLISPVMKRPCMYWQVSIDEVGLGDWVERGWTDQRVPFVLRDATGIARIDPEGARCDLVAASSTFGSSQALGRLGILFDRLEIELNYPSTSKVRFNERIVTAGTRLTVLGHAQLEPMQDATAADAGRVGYRGELPMWPVFSSSRRKPLLIGDA